MADCKNRKYRLVDDWRGHRCDIDWKDPQRKESVDGLFSTASTVYKISQEGGSYVIKGMSTVNSLVAQMYQEEGMSHIGNVNVTSYLVAQRSSPGDISASGETVDNLHYEFADSTYKWNDNRDLKQREPFLSSGNYYEDDQATMKAGVLKILNHIYDDMHAHGIDQATVQDNHKYSLEAPMFMMFAMEYE